VGWRLQVWSACVLVFLLAGLGVAIYELNRTNHLRQIDASLNERASLLDEALRGYLHDEGERPPRRDNDHRPPPRGDFGFDGPPPFEEPDGPPPNEHPRRPPRSGLEFSLLPEVAALFGPGAPAFYFTIWSREGAVLARSANAPLDEQRPPAAGRDAILHLRNGPGTREIVRCSRPGECIVAGCFIEGDLAAIHRFGWALGAVETALLAFGLAAGWWIHARAIEPLESAFARQQKFAADVAHELRTPLAAIIADTQSVLARDRTADEYRDTVQADLNTAQKMRRLTDSLLELTRLDAGTGEGARRSVNLAELVRGCLKRIEPLAAGRQIAIHCMLDRASVSCVPDRMEQVISNLLMNAIDYNRVGGEVHIRTGTCGGAALLSVRDTGIGIAQADILRIFERFYRVDGAGGGEGHTGLGLAICQAIVEAHGGTIEVNSVMREGTTFTVRLPG
jgi:signal transduction histidine kinase